MVISGDIRGLDLAERVIAELRDLRMRHTFKADPWLVLLYASLLREKLHVTFLEVPRSLTKNTMDKLKVDE